MSAELITIVRIREMRWRSLADLSPAGKQALILSSLVLFVASAMIPAKGGGRGPEATQQIPAVGRSNSSRPNQAEAMNPQEKCPGLRPTSGGEFIDGVLHHSRIFFHKNDQPQLRH